MKTEIITVPYRPDGDPTTRHLARASNAADSLRAIEQALAMVRKFWIGKEGNPEIAERWLAWAEAEAGRASAHICPIEQANKG